MVDDDLEVRTTSLAKKSLRHLVVGLVLLPIIIGCFVVGLINVRTIFLKVTLLDSVQPSNRAEVFFGEIDKVKEKVAEQYAEHTSKMEDENILDMNVRFNLVYNAAFEHERDFGQFIKNYQSTVYQVSSKTRGSGAWFEFYNRDIEKLKASSIERQSKLIKYTKSVQ